MAGTSALLKNAANVRDQLATYQDSLKAFEYSNSGYTDTALADYSAYLNDRIKALTATNSISGQSKALSLTKSLDSATKQNISSSIQRENIQIMSGNATLQDKYNLIRDQYVRAVGNGDMTLAQSLMSQAYSVDQTIQLQAKQAADAAATLAKAGATATAGGQEHIATNLNNALQQLNQDIKNNGQKDFNKTIQDWVKTNTPTLTALGVILPKGAQPNYFDIVNGVTGAMYNAHMLAYTAELPYNPDTAQNYYTAAQELAHGIKKVPTLAGDKTIQEVQQAAANPAQFIYDQASGGFVQSKQTGNQVSTSPDNFGKVVPTYSGSIATTVLPVQTVTQLTKLGLNISSTNKDGSANNGVQVQATANSPQWLRNVLGQNGVTDAYINGQGIQFTADGTNGGKSVYTLTSDNRGLHGLFESSAEGDRLVGGDYGYNPSSNNPTSGTRNNSGGVPLPGSGMDKGPHMSLNSDFVGTSDLLTQAQAKQDAITAANAAAAKAMLAYTPPPLPNISINNTPPPAPVAIAAPAAPATKSVSQAAPVASPAKSPQNPGSFNLQGGGGIRLQ